MFEGVLGRGVEPDALKRLGDWLSVVLARREALSSTPTEVAGWLGHLGAAARLAHQAQAAQLVAIGALFAHRFAQCAQAQEWVADAETAVAAEVGAELRVSRVRAAGLIYVARAMRERLPKTAAVFVAGDIDMEAFRTIVFRTDLITDPDILARVDGVLAVNVGRWSSMTRARLSAKLDQVVARVDADAVRRRREVARGREIWIGGEADGIAQISGSLFTPDAHALDARLTALAATVCPQDPRTTAQRRADALGALAAGADRLGCRCGTSECAAGPRPASPVTIQVIAEQTALRAGDGGAGGAAGSELRADGLITPDLLAELAHTATLVPLAHPGDAPPEPGRFPSAALAAFVRARDLTCRWPGCDHPAADCDLDHTIPHAQGGPTHAANLKCYCRTHHLVKTFWGWTDQQLADGTLILTSPSGQTYVTTPASALLFPSLCHAVGGMPAPEAPPQDHCADRTAMMPTRRRTRTQDRAARIAAERQHNRDERHARQAAEAAARGPEPPPPF